METTGCFKHNAVAFQVAMYMAYSNTFEILVIIQEGIYFRLGQLMAMAFVHGGAAIRIIGPSVSNYLSGIKPSDLIVGIDEVPDGGVCDILWKVHVHVTSIMRLFTMEDIISYPMHSCHNSLTWESCRAMISSHWYL